MKEWLNKYFSDGDLNKIKEEVSKIELSTSGEIRLSLREKRSFWEKLYRPHELAVKDFEKLGIANTKFKTGLLVFVIFDERYYDILADEGIYQKIPDSVWNSLEEKLKEEFRSGAYAKGILHILGGIGEVLRKEFPREAGDLNELPDEVVVN